MIETIVRGSYRWGIAPTPEALARMEEFARLVIEKNKVMNLTAVVEPKEFASRHFLDCLYLLTCANMPGKRILDVGSGAGFPAVPLLCYDPSLDITALDSTEKRVDFIGESCMRLGLKINTICARAEELALKPGCRESFDIVISRAVAPLGILAELCLPFLKVGGQFLALKSENAQTAEEAKQAVGAIDTLGGRIAEYLPYSIPDHEERHQVIKVYKVRPTPDGYPRRFAKIQSKPL